MTTYCEYCNSHPEDTFKLLPLGWFRFSPSGAIHAANPKIIELLRYPDQTAFLQANAWNLFAEPSLREYIQNNLEVGDDILNFEAKLRRHNDEIIWTELNVHLVEDKTTATRILECAVRDITAQKQVSQALRESNLLVKTFLDGVGEGIIVYDREFRYQDWNAYMENLSGLTSAQVLGSAFKDTFPAWDEPEVEETLRRVLDGETISRKNIPFNIPQTGRSGRYDVVYVPRAAADGEVTGVIAFVRDRTDSHGREFERGRIEAEARKLRMGADVLGRLMLSTGVLQDIPARLKLICNEAATYLGVDSAHICLLQNDKLVHAASYGLPEEILPGLQVPLSHYGHFNVKVFREKRMLFWNDLQDDRIIVDDALRDLLRIRSILATPLLVSGKAIGVLTLMDSREPRAFTGNEMEFIIQMGNHAAIVIENIRLFENLRVANKDLFQAYDATLAGWAKALELRDQETEGHTQRVTKLTLELARKLGMSEEELTHVYRGAILHDIGKMGVPDSILLKPGSLNDAEWEIMRRHPTYAYEMLKPIEYLRPALDIPYCHHERWDGNGYPRGLKGEEIPRTARIFAVVDVWDALTSTRPYREGWGGDRVMDYLQAEAGKHFDPLIVEKFLEIVGSRGKSD